jgi:hypothetical protein
MGNALRAGLVALAVTVSACGPLAPAGTRSDFDSEATGQEMAESGVLEKVTGGGQFEHPTFGIVTISFVAIRHADGRVSGNFQQHQPAFGFTYKGEVTCFAVDPVNHRAWIGGVLTQSNDPDPITEVGDDAWFRVLDSGQGSAEPDRSTFLGFEMPPPGIVTSEEYCQLKIWPDDNARTWPVVHGNIVIH